VSGRLDHLEAADAIARRQEHVGPRLHVRPGARELAVDDVLARMNLGVQLGHRDLDRAVEALAELVERADVVAVTVRQGDAPDRGAGLFCGPEQRITAPRDRRVDEREAVVLADEKRVHEAQPRELDEIRGDLTYAHRRP
jgi:hypothetical protein